MKVQSWRYLIISVALLIATPVYAFYRAEQGGISNYVSGVTVFVLSLNLLYISLNEKRFQKEQKLLAENRRILHKMFGRFGSVAPYAGLALMLISSIIVWATHALLFPVLLLLLAVVYTIWLFIAMNRHRERGADAEAQRDDNPQR